MTMYWSAHISWLFGEWAYLERVGAARAAGFRWLETAWPPQDARTALPQAVARHRIEVALLNCDAGQVAHGERGFLNDPRRREAAEQAFLAAAELGDSLGVRNLNLLVGRALPDIGEARQRAAILGALRALATEAAARGMRILLEPINAIENPGYLAPTPAAAAALIEAVGSEAIGMLLDVYHVACSGDDPIAAIERHAEVIAHVQLADWPGRGQPGSGSLDVPGILEALEAAGYEGAVGLEYAPRGGTPESLRFLRDARAPLAPLRPVAHDGRI
ncbi:MAG: TIM barrel protein [Solirubrobacteraceae bacterium]